jgi:hypothetical protein
MTTQWYYQLMGETVGPLSANELKEKACAGQVREDSLVRKGAEGEWVAAWHVKGLFDATGRPVEPLNRL